MWKCKHCKTEFDFKRTTDKANHSRWCSQNPKLQAYRLAGRKIILQLTDQKFGTVKERTLQCEICKEPFSCLSRDKVTQKRFCSRNCANSVGGQEKVRLLEEDGLLHYTTLCFRVHQYKCCICGFDKIVAVHHYDENRENNRIENLIPICLNHHQMWHTKRFHKEIKSLVDKWVQSVVEDIQDL